MVLPVSGTLSIDDLRTEFSATGTRGLSDFYRGGAFVPDTPANAGVPISGRILLSDFYGADATVGDIPEFSAYKTTNESRTSTSLLADNNLGFPTVAAGNYIVEAFLIFESASTSSPGHAQIQFQTSSTFGSSRINIVGAGAGTTAPNTDDFRSSLNSTNASVLVDIDSVNVTAVFSGVGYTVRGGFNTTGVGSFGLFWGQSVSQPGNATSLKLGSWLKLWEIP